MPKPYPLTILTPEHAFYSGDAYSLTVGSIGGRISVLAGHIPMVTALTVSTLTIRDEAGEHEAFHSEGFMEVSREGVSVFVQACEWPEEISEARAQEAAKRAEARLQQSNISPDMVAHSKVGLMRAKMRLKVKGNTQGK